MSNGTFITSSSFLLRQGFLLERATLRGLKHFDHRWCVSCDDYPSSWLGLVRSFHLVLSPILLPTSGWSGIEERYLPGRLILVYPEQAEVQPHGNVLKLDYDDGCTTLWNTEKNTELYSLNKYVLSYIYYISIKLLEITTVQGDHRWGQHAWSQPMLERCFFSFSVEKNISLGGAPTSEEAWSHFSSSEIYLWGDIHTYIFLFSFIHSFFLSFFSFPLPSFLPLLNDYFRVSKLF